MDLLLTGTLLTLEDRRMKGLISQWLSLMTHIVQSELKGYRDLTKYSLEKHFSSKVDWLIHVCYHKSAL